MTSFAARLSTIGVIFSLIGALIVFKMLQIQNSNEVQQIRQTLEAKSFEKQRIDPERGSIYDRWGHLLAGNTIVYEVGVDMRYVENPQTIIETLSGILNIDCSGALNKALQDYKEGNAVYRTLIDFVDPDKILKIDEIKKNYEKDLEKGRYNKDGSHKPDLTGLIWQSHLQRTYPENDIASNILGYFTFRDRQNGHGVFGIEEKYNEMLSGTSLDVVIPINPNLAQDIPAVPPGESLLLTIDINTQNAVERIMDQAVKTSGAKAGTAIVIDPRTGEILAMTTTQRVSLNEYWKYGDLYPQSQAFDSAIGKPYEPGSVFKVITMASALDAGAVTPETKFNDPGFFYYGGIYVYNWDGLAHGEQDMIGCLQLSLNVCLSWVATQIGADKFYQYMQAFGIDRRTNIDLADETNYPLRTPKDQNCIDPNTDLCWYDSDLVTNSFGQGLSLTPIQMVMAISAVANDGKMVAPHVLKGFISKGQQHEITPQVIRNPISAKTAHTLSDMLAVSLEKEASKALVPGYRVAGKTGTAQIPGPNGKYLTNKTNASFVGWGPVDDPRFLVYIWLEEPTSSEWGSVVAAPVFSEIVQYLVIQMNIPPDSIRMQKTTQ